MKGEEGLSPAEVSGSKAVGSKSKAQPTIFHRSLSAIVIKKLAFREG